MNPRRFRLVWVGLILLVILILTSIPVMTHADLLERITSVAGDNTIMLTNAQFAALQGAETLLLLEPPPSFVFLPMVIR